MPVYNDDREVTYEIVEEIGVISTQSTGWTRELNVVAWNGGQAKYDIREWSPMRDRMGRGVTLNEQEMRAIMNLLKNRNRGMARRGSGERMSYTGPVRTYSEPPQEMPSEERPPEAKLEELHEADSFDDPIPGQEASFGAAADEGGDAQVSQELVS